MVPAGARARGGEDTVRTGVAGAGGAAGAATVVGAAGAAGAALPPQSPELCEMSRGFAPALVPAISRELRVQVRPFTVVETML